MDAPLKVLIADDHPLMLQGIRRALESADDIEVAGEARSGEELLALVARRRPDIVLLDLNMPAPDGIECLEQIRETHPEIKSVVISAYDDRANIDAALHAGACAYMMKSVSSVDVASALRQIASGAVFHAPSPTEPSSSESGNRSAAECLTARERTILEAVANGLTTRAISGQLWLSEHTVKFHLTNIYRKLGVTNRSAAVRYAFEEGLVGGVAAGKS